MKLLAILQITCILCYVKYTNSVPSFVTQNYYLTGNLSLTVTYGDEPTTYSISNYIEYWFDYYKNISLFDIRVPLDDGNRTITFDELTSVNDGKLFEYSINDQSIEPFCRRSVDQIRLKAFGMPGHSFSEWLKGVNLDVPNSVYQNSYSLGDVIYYYKLYVNSTDINVPVRYVVSYEDKEYNYNLTFDLSIITFNLAIPPLYKFSLPAVCAEMGYVCNACYSHDFSIPNSYYWVGKVLTIDNGINIEFVSEFWINNNYGLSLEKMHLIDQNNKVNFRFSLVSKNDDTAFEGSADFCDQTPILNPLPIEFAWLSNATVNGLGNQFTYNGFYTNYYLQTNNSIPIQFNTVYGQTYFKNISYYKFVPQTPSPGVFVLPSSCGNRMCPSCPINIQYNLANVCPNSKISYY